MNSQRRVVLLLAAGALSVGLAPAGARADAGIGPPVSVGWSPAILSPVLHGYVAADVGGPYPYTAKGYFKIGTKTVARLHSFSGTAQTGQTLPISVDVTAFERREIRAAARRYHHKRTTLTIVWTLNPLPTPPPPSSLRYGTDTFLTIPGV
jgi:hypothetical protein